MIVLLQKDVIWWGSFAISKKPLYDLGHPNSIGYISWEESQEPAIRFPGLFHNQPKHQDALPTPGLQRANLMPSAEQWNP